MPCARASATRADWNAARASTTCVRAALRVSEAVMTSALPEHAGAEAVARLRDLLLGEAQVLVRGGDLLASRRQVEQCAAHVDGRLLPEVAPAHSEFLTAACCSSMRPSRRKPSKTGTESLMPQS